MTAFALKDIAEFVPILAQGALVTIEVFVCGLIVATALGLLWALLRVSGVPALAAARVAPLMALAWKIRMVP